MPLTKHFYVRLVYGTGPTTIDISEPAADIRIASTPVAGTNVAAGGKREVVFQRLDTFVALAFRKLPLADMNAIKTWLGTHALKGKQSALTLDRLATSAGQWEYDNYNTFFDKAELVGAPGQIAVPPVEVPRTMLSRALYSLNLIFRQGV